MFDGCPIKGLPQTRHCDRAMMYGGFQDGPQLVPHDAEKRQLLERLVAVSYIEIISDMIGKLVTNCSIWNLRGVVFFAVYFHSEIGIYVRIMQS